MRKLGIAAIIAAGALTAAPAAQAFAPPEVKPCESIAVAFETANVQMDLPDEVDAVAGPAVRTVCGVTG